MNILVDNTGLQNFGACLSLSKKCQEDENAIDDFIQICIQMIFYDKLLDSPLVPQHTINISDEIINIVNAYDKSIFDSESNHKQILELDKILNEIAIDYDIQIDSILESCKQNFIKNPELSVPVADKEMSQIIGYATKAIQTENTYLIEQLRQEAAKKKNDSYVLDIVTRNINAEGSIMDKILLFNKKNKIWNDAMTIKIISSLRICSNRALAEYFSCPYSPAVIRAKAIQEQRDILFLKISDILNQINNIKLLPNEIKLPSFESYLLSKGRGNPEDILKHTIELRNTFSPVREYIRKELKGKKLNKTNYSDTLKALTDIATDICNRLNFPKASSTKNVIENTYSLPIGAYSVPIPDLQKIFSRGLKKCYSAFTEITSDMLNMNNRYNNDYRKRLINNCVK